MSKPFLKWAGGKRQIINKLLSHIPSFERYFEPFIGGGALFFALRPQLSFISDINPELINVYKVIKNNVYELIADLKQHKNEEEYYYYIRNIDRTETFKNWDPIKKASRTIYLNKTCYNGLYRVNSEGYFNVPFGNYVNPKICDEENLIECSKILANSIIESGDFNIIKNIITQNDFVYFDPPYYPLSKTSSFTKYYKDDFPLSKQIELKELCDWLTQNNIKFMLSNSSADVIIDLYKNYDIIKIKAKRYINCDGSKRGSIDEIIVKNY